MRPLSLSVAGRRFLTGAALVVGLVAVSSEAQAQSCPPGSWYCDDVTPAPVKQGDGDASEAASPASPAGNGGTTIIVNTAPPPVAAQPAPPPPPVVKVAPAPVRAKPVVVAPRYEPRIPAKQPRRAEWGFNMRIQGALMDSKDTNAAKNAGMGGIGFSLRARPSGYFALDFGLDFIGGRDYHGFTRSEVPFTVNAMLFVNPKSKAQFYFLGGLGWSTAHVETEPGASERYNYFGVQGGVGLELRLTRHMALNGDLIGFVRGRTDEKAAWAPEFVDPATGKRSNTSGGGLLRGGLTIYW